MIQDLRYKIRGEKGFTQHHFCVHKSGAGFTLIELLIYTAVFTIAVGVFSGVLITFTRVETQTSVDSELTQQLSFVQSTIQRLVRDSANIENPAGVASSSLVLRMASTTSDPTVISSDANGIYLKQGTEEVIPLTNDQVKVSQFQITKYENPEAHATVQVNISLTYNSQNPYQRLTRALKVAINRVSAATFDDSLVPNTDNSFSLGVASTNRWKDINISNLLNVGQLASDPIAGAQNGSIYYNTASSTFRGYTNGSWSRLGGVGWESSSTAIYNTNSGNVGIGTASPGAKLDVSGRIRTTEFQLGITSTTAGYILTADANGVGTWQAPPSSLPASPQSGDMVYYDGSSWSRLAAGTVGQSLKIALDSYTKLLTHADGTDGGTTFTDETGKTITNTEKHDTYTKLMLHLDNNVTDSAQGLTVTNNNVTFSNTSPKFSYYGIFNGTNAYLSVPDSADWAFGTGDFTIDTWVMFPSFTYPNYQSIAGQFKSFDYNTFDKWEFMIREWDTGSSAPCSISFSSYQNSNYSNDIEVSAYQTLNANTWYHVAVVKSSNVYKIYLNGANVTTGGSVTSGLTNLDVASTLDIGRENLYQPVAYAYFNGKMDDVRVSKGIARWTSDFTPPASPYGTVATVTSQKEFGTASAEFHGSGDYISTADSDDWNFGSGNFTIDFWVRFNSVTGSQTIYCQQLADESEQLYLTIKFDTSVIEFQARTGGADLMISRWNLSTVLADTWYHFAIVRKGTASTSDWLAFQNGVSLSSNLFNGSAGATLPNVNAAFNIGAFVRASVIQYLNGYLDEFRVSKGIARWTSNFTPPASAHSPMPNWSN